MIDFAAAISTQDSNLSPDALQAIEDCLDAAYAWKHDGLPYSEAIKVGVVYDQDGSETSAARTQCRALLQVALRRTKTASGDALQELVGHAVSLQNGIVLTNRGAFLWDDLRGSGATVRNERPPHREWGAE